jgi:hypothetical protein
MYVIGEFKIDGYLFLKLQRPSTEAARVLMTLDKVRQHVEETFSEITTKTWIDAESSTIPHSSAYLRRPQSPLI